MCVNMRSSMSTLNLLLLRVLIVIFLIVMFPVFVSLFFA